MEQQIKQPSHQDYKVLMSNALLEISSIVLANNIEGTEEETLFIGDVLLGALNILNGNSNNYVEEE